MSITDFSIFHSGTAYDALEFDEMLKGGWRIDFITWPLFGVFLVYAIWHCIENDQSRGQRCEAAGRRL